jgi:hypothetical protein
MVMTMAMVKKGEERREMVARLLLKMGCFGYGNHTRVDGDY